MNHILVIGSEGFIGHHLVKFYLKNNWQVSGIDRIDNPSADYHYIKLLSGIDFVDLFINNNFTYVINAAGSGNVGFSVEHPISDFEANCFETARILEALRLSRKESRYLHISSAAVYGNPDKLPIAEQDKLHPLSPYGWHKMMSEMLCREYYELYNIRSCIIRPFSVYGPGLRKQLFWDLYHRTSGKTAIELFGTGDESRDFIYIDDLVQIIHLLITNSPMTAEAYNAANGVEIRIREAVSEFIRFFDPVPTANFNGKGKKGDPLNWRADIQSISALGYQQKVTFEEGIERTFNWINGL
ncbi:MAG: SDR family oxidoreductase [Candidatus Pseudobacter hemicellulosilyticus]|uniref:SDR family oxidoreductase n=1 Tax=Candidatus Pseudobacter hemicellulosilyticus TaxID=3121375 RepID=A0AAJ5WVW5_9BACT|nr:MAG: SDR family oxidoreductase [Pseudobacter sp.]